MSEPRGSLLDRALRVFAPVQAGEAATALLLMVNIFVLLTCYYVLKVVREPLILLGGGAELKAYASAGQTLLLLAVVPAFGLLASRVDRIRLLTIVQIIFAACLVGFYVLARVEAPIGLAFYLWLGIFNMLVVSNFWSFANDVYSPDQGKRLFPIVGVGGSIGAILGALLPAQLGRWLGITQLLLIAAGGLVVSIVLYRLVDRRERIERDDRGTVELVKPEATHPVERKGGFGLVLSDRYLRIMAAMVLIGTVVNTTGEYVIGKMATEASAALAGDARGDFIRTFYSNYYGVVNIVSFVLQAFAVSRLIKLVGVRRALLVLPLIVLGGWIAFFAFATVSTIRVTKTAENSVDYSLHNTVRQALYLPTSRASKYKAKAAIDTFFVRMADVIAGVGIVFVLVDVLELGVRAFAIVNLALAAVWFVLAIRTGRLFDERTTERADRASRGLRETLL
jgi:ATP:ADP antiporter, AAA family